MGSSLFTVEERTSSRNSHIWQSGPRYGSLSVLEQKHNADQEMCHALYTALLVNEHDTYDNANDLIDKIALGVAHKVSETKGKTKHRMITLGNTDPNYRFELSGRIPLLITELENHDTSYVIDFSNYAPGTNNHAKLYGTTDPTRHLNTVTLIVSPEGAVKAATMTTRMAESEAKELDMVAVVGAMEAEDKAQLLACIPIPQYQTSHEKPLTKEMCAALLDHLEMYSHEVRTRMF